MGDVISMCSYRRAFISRARRMVIMLVCATLLWPTHIGAQDERISIEAHHSDLAAIIHLLATQARRNVIVNDGIRTRDVTLSLHDVTFENALATIAEAYGLAVHRTGTVLFVGDAATMGRRYGATQGREDTQTAVIPLHHAHADEVAAELGSALPKEAILLGDKRSNALIVTGNMTTIARARDLVAALDSALGGHDADKTNTQPLHHIKPSDAVAILAKAGVDATLIPDDRQNVIVFSGSADAIGRAQALARAIDTPGREVTFEVKVVDIQPTIDQDSVGFSFGGAPFGSASLGQVPVALLTGTLAVNTQIDALIQRGHAEILARPRISTLNNKEASLLIGQTYPIVTVNQQTGYPSVQNVDVGVQLKVTPTIGSDGSITADLHPQYSQIAGFNSSYPIIANRRVDSTLRVADGQTIVLAGLFSDVTSETITKLPILGDLPIVGGVFRNRQRNHTRDEIVFFITPHLL